MNAAHRPKVFPKLLALAIVVGIALAIVVGVARGHWAKHHLLVDCVDVY